MIRGRRTKGESLPFAYRKALAIALRMIGSYSPLLIEYLWKHILLTRKRKTKCESFPFIYRIVLAIALRKISGYSLSFIDEL